MQASKILIIRHGEKLGAVDVDAPDDGIGLSTRGYERAAALSVYIPSTFGKPDFIFAAARSKHSSRPIETIMPLANMIGVTPNEAYADADYTLVATELKDAKYAGKLVLICWHHGKILALAQALGGNPPHWPSDVFDRVWMIDSATPAATNGIPIQNIAQRLLYGDSAT